MGARKTRSDCTVGTFEKKHGLPPGALRNRDGRDTRSDKRIGTIRKEAEQGKNAKTDSLADFPYPGDEPQTGGVL